MKDYNSLKRNSFKAIENFIKEYEYTYKVADILKSYKKYWVNGRYTSYTMTICIKHLEEDIRILLGINRNIVVNRSKVY